MTEEEPKITSVVKTPREKNPGRVAAGKRLAAISKEAKERKKLERASLTTGTGGTAETSVILVGGLVVSGVALYFLKSHCVFYNKEGTEGTVGTAGSEGTEVEQSERSVQSKQSSLPRDFIIYPPKDEKRFLMYSMHGRLNK